MKTILFFNHKQKQCGVYQYGYRTGSILTKSTKFNFVYCEVESEAEYLSLMHTHNPVAVFYNYHPSTMSWFGNDCIVRFNKAIHFGLHHEGSEPGIRFNGGCIVLDSTFKDTHDHFAVPRPLIEGVEVTYKQNDIPVISSFGFGFGNKGFGRLVKMVNDQFDEAIIRLHIPFAYYGDRNGDSVRSIYPGCQNEVKKPGIKLVITNDFMTDAELLNWLAASNLNAFLYDEMPGRGLSSVIDYALSVNVPLAITKTHMFRHIVNTSPSICVEDRSLKDIIQSGAGALQQYRERWSNQKLIEKYELISIGLLNNRVK